MTLTMPQLLGWFAALYWPLTRFTGLLLTEPFLGAQSAPAQLKVLLSFALAGAMAAWYGPWPPLPDGGAIAALILYAILNIAYGALIGLIGQIAVSMVASAGEMAGLGMGMGFATMTGLATDTAPSVMYNLYYWAGFMVWLGLGGPFLLIQATVLSFHGQPAGIADFVTLRGMTALGGASIASALTIALPALATGFTLNLVTGIANILAPQLNIFSVGFPLLFLGGILVVGLSIFYVEPVVAGFIAEASAVLGPMAHGRV